MAEDDEEMAALRSALPPLTAEDEARGAKLWNRFLTEALEEAAAADLKRAAADAKEAAGEVFASSSLDESQASELLPKKTTPEEQSAYELERGQDFALDGNIAAALEALRASTDANPLNHKAWDAKAQVLLMNDREGRGEEELDERIIAHAVECARKAVAIIPDWAPARVSLGRSLLAARRWREAEAALAGLDFHGDAVLAAEAAEAEAAALAGPQERTLTIGGRPLLTTAAEGPDCSTCENKAAGPSVGVWECSVVLAMLLDWRHGGKKWAAEISNGAASTEYYPEGLEDATVLELGSGLGVAGLAAGLLGADVTLTDTEDVVPRTLARVNAHAGLLESAGGFATCAAFDWREDLPEAVAKQKPYGLVLSADCVYHPKMLPPFLRALDAVAGPETEVLVCHKCRRKDGVLDGDLEAGLRARFRDVAEADPHPLYASRTIVTWSCKGHTGPAPACPPPPVPEDVPDEVIRVSASPRNKVLSAVLEGSNESTSKSGSGL